VKAGSSAQGNQNDQVLIARYATEGSFDVYMWQVCERKAGYIDQIMRGDITGREIDNVGENVLSYAETKALATGNPLVIEQAGVQAEMAKLDRRARAHHSDQRRLELLAGQARRDAEMHRQEAAAIRAVLDQRADTSGDKFRMELDGTVHTSRADAGAVLFAKAQALIGELVHRSGRDETRTHTVGRLAGFPVRADAIKRGLLVEARIVVDLGAPGAVIMVRLNSDDIASRRPEALVAGMETSIRNLDSRAAGADRRAREAAEQASVAASRLQAFPDQAKLDKLRHRYTEILDQLNADADATAIAADVAAADDPTAAVPATAPAAEIDSTRAHRADDAGIGL
jgi:hypothetical protein